MNHWTQRNLALMIVMLFWELVGHRKSDNSLPSKGREELLACVSWVTVVPFELSWSPKSTTTMEPEKQLLVLVELSEWPVSWGSHHPQIILNKRGTWLHYIQNPRCVHQTPVPLKSRSSLNGTGRAFHLLQGIYMHCMTSYQLQCA